MLMILNSQGDKVGVYAKNCPGWTIIELAVSSMGMVLVPLYDSLGANAVEYVCNHAELKVVFVQVHLTHTRPIL